MKVEDIKNTRHVSVVQFSNQILGKNMQCVQDWAEENLDTLLKNGIAIIDGHMTKLSMALVPIFITNYDCMEPIRKQLNSAVEELIEEHNCDCDDKEYRQDVSDHGYDEFRFCGSIVNSDAIKHIKKIDSHLSSFKVNINNTVVDNLCNDVRSILFRMTAIALREIEETYKREKGE